MGTFHHLLSKYYVESPISVNQATGWVDSILSIFKGVANSDTVSIWVKAILILVCILCGVGGGIWWAVYKNKMREKKSEQTSIKDEIQNIGNNQSVNNQTESDAQDIRNLVKKPGSKK